MNDSPDRFYDISPSCKVSGSYSVCASHPQAHTFYDGRGGRVLTSFALC